MTVNENVAFGLRMARVDKKQTAARVAEALLLVGLEEFGERLPSQLSGGQQQRVAVARALVRRPAVLLLDEPLGALDLKLRKRLQVELSQIHREVGTTFVYVTHDQEEAMTMADRVAVLNVGEIEQIGAPRGDLQASAVAFRRRLHRRVELLRRGGRRGRERHGRPGRWNQGRPHRRRAELGHEESDPDGAPRVDSHSQARERPARVAARTDDPGCVSGQPHRVATECAASQDLVLIAVHSKGDTESVVLETDQEVALWWKPEDAVLIEEAGSTEKEAQE